jgi:hypothetical protein
MGYNGNIPLVNVYKTMERSTILYLGKSTISMAIFKFANCNSHYQRLLKTRVSLKFHSTLLPHKGRDWCLLAALESMDSHGGDDQNPKPSSVTSRIIPCSLQKPISILNVPTYQQELWPSLL